MLLAIYVWSVPGRDESLIVLGCEEWSGRYGVRGCPTFLSDEGRMNQEVIED